METIVYEQRQPAGASVLFLPMGRPQAQALRRAGIAQGGISRFAGKVAIGRPEHPYHFFIYTLVGGGRFLCDERGARREGTMAQGQLWQIPQPIPYRLWCDGPWEFLWWSLTPTPTYAGIREVASLQPASAMPRLVAAVEGIAAEDRGDIGESGQTISHYAAIIAAYVRRQALMPRHPSARARSALAPLWEAVAADPARRWDLASLGRLCGMDRFRLLRAMRRSHRCTPMQAVARLRMELAEDLLLNTDDTLERIAEQVGYASGFSLSKAFKIHAGESPVNYRRRMR
jgi:AraC-like DNA-binding protein